MGGKSNSAPTGRDGIKTGTYLNKFDIINTLAKSNLNSLSIGSGLVAAVLLCMKRGVIIYLTLKKHQNKII